MEIAKHTPSGYRLWILGATALLLASGGCGPTASSPESVDPIPEVEVSVIESTLSTDVLLVNATEFAAELEKKRGKVVLLDMWASW